MKLNNVFILLCCGTIFGGVLAPIFMTDVQGYNRMIEWFPNDLKFDWGSFLGGFIAAVAAVALFCFQRLVDRNEAMKRKLSYLREFCTQSGVMIELLTKHEVDTEQLNVNAAAKHTGGGGAVKHIREHYDTWDTLNDEEKEDLRKYSYDLIRVYEEEFERTYRKYERVVVEGETPSDVTKKWFEAVTKFESISTNLRSVKSNLNKDRWLSRYDDSDCKSAIDGVQLIHEDILNLRALLTSLETLCR